MGELRDFVLRRDRICFAYRLDPKHVCRDRWGRPHAPNKMLTLEHVPRVHYDTDPRRDDERHCVAICWAANVWAPSNKDLRAFSRRQLIDLYGEACQ